MAQTSTRADSRDKPAQNGLKWLSDKFGVSSGQFKTVRFLFDIDCHFNVQLLSAVS